MGNPCDLGVLLRHALDGVDEDQTDVCALNGGDGAEVGIFFNGVIDLGLAPHSGGIDEAVFAEFVFKIAVDGVAQLLLVGVGQILHAGVGVDACLRQDVLSALSANTIDIGQTDLDSLILGQVNTGNTCHTFKAPPLST